MQKIKSGDVSKLMQHLYFRHQLGLEKLENNVFEVLLPPPTEEELKEEQRLAAEEFQDQQDDQMQEQTM